MTTRRQILQTTAGLAGASALGLGFSIGQARAAEFTFKVGTDVPESHPLNVSLQQASDAIKKETGGRVQLDLYANNQLGGDPAMFSQLRSGALEVFLLSGVNVLSSLIPNSAIYGIGFAWPDSETVFKALDGKLGDALRKQIRAARLEVMDKIWNNGFRQITSSAHPVKAASDLSGFKIRVPVSALWVSCFQSLGASPTSLSFSEVYSALQTKVVDGQENPLAIIQAANLFEVQKYCSLTNHMWDGWWCLWAPSAWNTLPDDLKEIVARNLNEHAVNERAAVIQENDKLQQILAGKGLTFNTVDRDSFKEKLKAANFYSTWKGKFGDELWGLLEEYTGKLV